MNLPEAVPERLARRGELLKKMRAVLREDQLVHRDEDLVAYECDALSAYRQRPMMVALPETTQEVAAVLKTCSELDIPIVPWGAGTGL